LKGNDDKKLWQSPKVHWETEPKEKKRWQPYHQKQPKNNEKTPTDFPMKQFP
jgi:hypothetical protein